MDWSKAKTVLIVAMLITDLILGGYYLSDKITDSQRQQEAASNMELFLEQKGAVLNAGVPAGTTKLPVVFISITKGEKQNANYGGYAIEADGADVKITPLGNGETKGEVMSAAEACAKFVSRLGEDALSGLRIEDISLVYWVDLSSMSSVSTQDTAVPAWKFSTSEGPVYIEAFLE